MIYKFSAAFFVIGVFGAFVWIANTVVDELGPGYYGGCCGFLPYRWAFLVPFLSLVFLAIGVFTAWYKMLWDEHQKLNGEK